MLDVRPWVVFFFENDEVHAKKLVSASSIGRGQWFSRPSIKVDLSFLKGIHGRIVEKDGRWFYEDLSGLPTTWVDGRPLAPHHGTEVHENTTISISDTTTTGDCLTLVFSGQLEREHIAWRREATALPRMNPKSETFTPGMLFEDRHTYSLRVGRRKWSQNKLENASAEEQGRLKNMVQRESGVLQIDLKNVRVGNGLSRRTLLENVDLEVNLGDMVLVLGSSGAGKSTFLNAVSGYERAAAVVKFRGLDVYENSNELRKIARHVPQHDHLRMGDSVRATLNDALLLNAGHLSLDRRARRNRVDEVLGLFGLEEESNNLVAKLSGGQRKRLSIAVEYIADPVIFFLDEPDSGLDGKHARELMERLRQIADQGKIVMVISHSADQVAENFNKVLVLGHDSRRKCGTAVFYGDKEDAFGFFGVSSFSGIIDALDAKNSQGDRAADYFIDRYNEEKAKP